MFQSRGGFENRLERVPLTLIRPERPAQTWAIPSLVTLLAVAWVKYPRSPEPRLGYGDLAPMLRTLMGSAVVLAVWVLAFAKALAG